MIITRESKIECPKCKTEMQDGRLLANGLVWTGKKKDEVYENTIKGCEAKPAFSVVAFRCPSCNYLELYTNEEEAA